MPVITVEDVLKHAEQFERMLSDYYARLSERSNREGVRLLADYMSRHRRRIGEALQKLSQEQVKRVCSEPLRYAPQAADCRCFEGIELPPGAGAEQVLDVAVTFDECLVRLYRQVLQQPMDQEVLELFESLVRTEQRDEIQLKKIKAMDYF